MHTRHTSVMARRHAYLSGEGVSGGGLEVGGGLSGGGLESGGGLQRKALSADANSSCVQGKARYLRH